jgi:hypothetical protein
VLVPKKRCPINLMCPRNPIFSKNRISQIVLVPKKQCPRNPRCPRNPIFSKNRISQIVLVPKKRCPRNPMCPRNPIFWKNRISSWWWYGNFRDPALVNASAPKFLKFVADAFLRASIDVQINNFTTPRFS